MPGLARTVGLAAPPPPAGGYYGGAPPGGINQSARDGTGGTGGNYPAAPGPGGAAFSTAPDPQLSALTGYASTQMSQQDPLLMEAIENFRKRMSTDTTARATGIAGGAIDDAAASAGQRAKEEASITGMSSGTQAQRGASISDAAQRAKAGAAAQIQMGELDRQDRLAGGFASSASMPGQRQLNWFGAAAGVAGQQAGNQIAGQQNQVSMAQLLQQQQQAQQAAMLNAYNLAYS